MRCPLAAPGGMHRPTTPVPVPIRLPRSVEGRRRGGRRSGEEEDGSAASLLPGQRENQDTRLTRPSPRGPALMPPRLEVCTGPRPRQRCLLSCQGRQRGGGGGKVFPGRTERRGKGHQSDGRSRAPSARRCHPAPNRRAQRRQHVRAAGGRPGRQPRAMSPASRPHRPPAAARAAPAPKQRKGGPPGLRPRLSPRPGARGRGGCHDRGGPRYNLGPPR